MSFAWETTVDDVDNVTEKMGIDMSWADAETFCDDELDHDAVESAALRGTDMDTQTNFAYAEIERQLKESGIS